MIECEGIIHGDQPFDWRDGATVFNTNEAIGRGFYLGIFLGEGYPRVQPSAIPARITNALDALPGSSQND